MVQLDIALVGPVTLSWLAHFALLVALALYGFERASKRAVGWTALACAVLWLLSLLR
jgi:hypothetical protein